MGAWQTWVTASTRRILDSSRVMWEERVHPDDTLLAIPRTQIKAWDVVTWHVDINAVSVDNANFKSLRK